ncbi:MAG: glycosyltransferase family 4 protein [Acidimicrobiales bacterium]|nr:glycosyltransferase family 4 protein [Acidimicrobiales bacterium]HRW36494.1 glycosyltransferase family 4 protein [Aquihabitans sp.]
MTDPHVVILGHAADRTGPPVYLLQLLRNLDLRGLRVTIVLLRGGELLPELQELAEVRVVGEPADVHRASPTLLAGEPGRVLARRAQLADLHDLALVVVNTAWSIHSLPWLPEPAPRVVVIVHELTAGVADILEPEPLATLLASQRFIAGCAAVERMLVEELEVARDRVEVIPYGVELGPAEAPLIPRRQLLASDGAFVVVAAAVPDRRKGPDLFVHLAATARRRRPDIRWAFRWIGADEADARLHDALVDRALLDADDLVRFLPPTPELRATLASADAFVLPSRQDAFPLAAVEAALAGLPLLCFDSGGIGALVEPGAGALVPYPDLDAMATQLATWHDDPAQRGALGATGRDRARRHHDVAVHAARFDEAVLGPIRGAGA